VAGDQAHLADVTQPVLAYHSSADHVVGPASLKVLSAALPETQLEVRELADSYHSRPGQRRREHLTGSLEFVRAHSRVRPEQAGNDG